MKLLVIGEIKPGIESLDELGIKYETTNQGILIELDKNYRLASPGENLKSKYIDYKYAPLISEYAKNDDKSLSTFIIKGDRLMASGNIIESNNKDYDYICDGLLRAYSKTKFFALQWVMAGQNELEELYCFIDDMLRSTEEIEKNKKM